MIEIKKIETGRIEVVSGLVNGEIIITATQWGLFQNGHEWSRHDTESEAVTEMNWMASDDYQASV